MREITAKVGSLVKAQMSLSLRSEVSRYSSNAGNEQTQKQADCKASTRED